MALRATKGVGRSKSSSQLNKITGSITKPSPLHLLDGNIDASQLSLQPSQLVKRSHSLTSLRSELRRAASGLDRMRPLHRSTFRSSVLKAFCLLIACVSGLFVGGAQDIFIRASNGNLTASAADVASAFDSSSRGLESIKHGDHGAIPLIEFLDALDLLSPAYDSMGIMFSVASREMTSNTKKLRQEFRRQLTAQREYDCCGDQNQSGNMATCRGGQSNHVPTVDNQKLQIVSCSGSRSSSRHPFTLQDLVLGTHLSSPTTPLVRSPLVTSSQQHHRHFPLVLKEPFESALWLSFALHFMEVLYGCIGNGDSPAACALGAYDTTLRHHQGPGMRAVAKQLMRLIPASQDSLRNRVGFTHDGPGFEVMMGRWARAISRHRKALDSFFAQWPPHRP